MCSCSCTSEAWPTPCSQQMIQYQMLALGIIQIATIESVFARMLADKVVHLVFAGHLIFHNSCVSRLAERLYLLASNMPSGTLPVACAQAVPPVRLSLNLHHITDWTAHADERQTLQQIASGKPVMRCQTNMSHAGSGAEQERCQMCFTLTLTV